MKIKIVKILVGLLLLSIPFNEQAQTRATRRKRASSPGTALTQKPQANSPIIAKPTNPIPASPAQTEAPKLATPLFTSKKAQEQYKELQSALRKYKRCLVTGPCTEQEMKAVTKTIKRLSIALGIVGGAAAAGALGYYVGMPYVRRKIDQFKIDAKEFGKEAAVEIIESAKEPAKEAVKELADDLIADASEKYRTFKDFVIQEFPDWMASLEGDLEDKFKGHFQVLIRSLKKYVQKGHKKNINKTIKHIRELKEQIEKEENEHTKVELEARLKSARKTVKDAKAVLRMIEEGEKSLYSLASQATIIQIREVLEDEALRENLITLSREYVDRVGTASPIVQGLRDIMEGKKVPQLFIGDVKMGVPRTITPRFVPTDQVDEELQRLEQQHPGTKEKRKKQKEAEPKRGFSNPFKRGLPKARVED